MSAHDDKRIQSIDSIKTYAHGTTKNLVCIMARSWPWGSQIAVKKKKKKKKKIDSIKTYAHGTTKNLVCKKEEIKCNKIIKQ